MRTEPTEYPLSIRYVGPTAKAKRITGYNLDGSSSGFHTGGAWDTGDGYIWKPLDGRPFANCPNHYSTHELEVLELMAGQPLFPQNWWEEKANGRRFLVRRRATIVTKYTPLMPLAFRQIEQAIRSLNANKWEIGDSIELAIDRSTGQLFFYDLSAAHPQTGVGAYAADDEWRTLRFFKLFGQDHLVDLRQEGRHLRSTKLGYQSYQDGYVYIYAAQRFIDFFWSDDVQGVRFLQNPTGSPRTWIVSKQPLSQEILDRYKLEYAWSPIH